jgi:hypothetical protein
MKTLLFHRSLRSIGFTKKVTKKCSSLHNQQHGLKMVTFGWFKFVYLSRMWATYALVLTVLSKCKWWLSKSNLKLLGSSPIFLLIIGTEKNWKTVFHKLISNIWVKMQCRCCKLVRGSRIKNLLYLPFPSFDSWIHFPLFSKTTLLKFDCLPRWPTRF